MMNYIYILLILFILILYYLIFKSFNSWYWRFCKLRTINPNIYKKYFNVPEISKYFNQQNNDLIMVSIASYRDDQCADTINNIKDNANNPQNLRFTICQQNSPLDEDCLKRVKDTSNIYVIRLNHTDAKGPNYARYIIQQRYRGEQYYLQIDSHTRMIKGWDTILKNQLDPMDLITQYPLEFKNVPKKFRGDPEKEGWTKRKNRGPLLPLFFDKDGILHYQSNYINTKNKSYIQPGLVSGFIFTHGEFNNLVPYDPNLYLFFGEQMDIAIRTYMAGYNIKTPKDTVIYHIYDRSYRNLWNPKNILFTKKKELEILSLFRLYVRLGYLNKKNIPKQYRFILNYKLKENNIRTLEDYQKFAKINIKEETIY